MGGSDWDFPIIAMSRYDKSVVRESSPEVRRALADSGIVPGIIVAERDLVEWRKGYTGVRVPHALSEGAVL